MFLDLLDSLSFFLDFPSQLCRNFVLDTLFLSSWLLQLLFFFHVTPLLLPLLHILVPEKFYLNCESDSNINYGGRTFVGDMISGGNLVSLNSKGSETVKEVKLATNLDQKSTGQ